MRASKALVTTTPLALVALLSAAPARADLPFDPYVISDVAEKVTPAVVNITTRRDARQGRMPPMFGELFGRQGRTPAQMGAGSGVIVSGDGQVVTNNHVVDGADSILVTLSDGRELEAKVIGVDKSSDLAFLDIDGEDLPHLSLGNSSKLRLGEIVLAVGNPFGVGQTVTMGIVSAKGRANVGIVDYEDFIQTDAAINPGNSGGALVNMKGELVGINTAILSRSGGAQGIGFAVPSNMVSPIRDQIAEHGRVRRGWLGVSIQNLTPELARSLDLETTHGVLVSDVLEDGPAAKAKLVSGDVVVAVDGKATHSTAQLRNRIALTLPGSKTKLSVLRDKKKVEVTVKLAEKEEAGVIARMEQESVGLTAGLGVRELDRELREQLRVPSRVDGVVVSHVEEGSPADRAGLEEGNLITAVNRQPVRSLEELENAIPEEAGEVLLRIYKRGMFTFVVLHE